MHLVGAAEGAGGLGHHEGRPAHAFDAPGDDQFGLAGLDGACGGYDRVHTRTAEAVDRGAADLRWQAGEQGRHARDVAVILARLVGTTEDHVIDGVPVEVVRGHQRLQRDGAQIVGAHRGERPAIAADRRADIGTDECVGHGLDLRRGEVGNLAFEMQLGAG